MLNKYGGNLTDSEAAAKVARVEKIYPMVRLLSAEQINNEHNCLFFGDQCPCLRQVCRKVLGGSDEVSERLTGDGIEYCASVRPVTVEGERRVLLVARPVNEQEVADEEAAYTDVVTGVRNRRYFDERLRTHHVSGGVAIVDLDDFKMVNDAYGHRVGDLVLGVVAAVIRDNIHSTDLLVRYDCDEFEVVMPDIAPDDFARRLHHVSEAIRSAVVPGNEEIDLSACASGVRVSGETIEEGVHRAATLLNRAKIRRGTVVTDADASETIRSQKPLVLIADDSKVSRSILGEMLKDDYRILEADSGRATLDAVDRYGGDLSLVLLDIVMSDMSGCEVLAELSRQAALDSLPVIMISSEDTDDVVLRAYDLGASDYISRPFDDRIVRRRVNNIIRLYAKQRRLTSLLSQQYNARVNNSRILVDIMASVMEVRNGESGRHVTHIEKLTELLLGDLARRSDKYSLGNEERSSIALASALHDIGKMSIDDAILNKPGRLTPEEFEIMKTHTTIGADMLRNLGRNHEGSALLDYAYQIARWHHERWDGTGYPDGLKGDDIPIAAQVVSVADVYDALTSVRVYKDAISQEEAIRMILDGECGAFNPLLIECLLEVRDRIAETLERPADVVAFPSV
ncbi:MAG: diguanylate cyclase [Collinsella sp.]|nr:diguanylate cyclase [Collinsella sp.]